MTSRSKCFLEFYNQDLHKYAQNLSHLRTFKYPLPVRISQQKQVKNRKLEFRGQEKFLVD